MIPSFTEISSEAAGSSHNLRSDGPNMAPGSVRRAGMSSEPWLGSSVTGRFGSAPRGGSRTTKRWSNWRPASSAIGTYEVILLRALSHPTMQHPSFTSATMITSSDRTAH
ncbi:MAG: hypothetical protein OJF50_003368 [Nitrospira sp.]|nr:hypothetical protein [Nitrospira sp.]